MAGFSSVDKDQPDCVAAEFEHNPQRLASNNPSVRSCQKISSDQLFFLPACCWLEIIILPCQKKPSLDCFHNYPSTSIFFFVHQEVVFFCIEIGWHECWSKGFPTCEYIQGLMLDGLPLYPPETQAKVWVVMDKKLDIFDLDFKSKKCIQKSAQSTFWFQSYRIRSGNH